MLYDLFSAKSSLRAKHTAIATILLVSFGVYINALFNGFVFDDLYLVLENPWIKDIRSIPYIFSSSLWSFHTSVPQLGLPLDKNPLSHGQFPARPFNGLHNNQPPR
jgi:hypothetical protein